MGISSTVLDGIPRAYIFFYLPSSFAGPVNQLPSEWTGCYCQEKTSSIKQWLNGLAIAFYIGQVLGSSEECLKRKR